MGRYRKVDTRIWNDRRFRGLGDDAKFVFLFLLTHPHMTSLGAMRASMAGLVNELKWEGKASGSLPKGFLELLDCDMIRADFEANFVWLPRFLRYNQPESPNVILGWHKVADLIPECTYKIELFNELKRVVQGLPDSYQEAFRKSFDRLREAFRIQEQEQEQEYTCAPPLSGAGARRAILNKTQSALFERWYEPYPRKRARKDAEKAWKALNPSEELVEVMLAKLELQKRSAEWQKPGRDGKPGGFIPYPATYLRQGRWEDECEVFSDAPQRPLSPEDLE